MKGGREDRRCRASLEKWWVVFAGEKSPCPERREQKRDGSSAPRARHVVQGGRGHHGRKREWEGWQETLVILKTLTGLGARGGNLMNLPNGKKMAEGPSARSFSRQARRPEAW